MCCTVPWFKDRRRCGAFTELGTDVLSLSLLCLSCSFLSLKEPVFSLCVRCLVLVSLASLVGGSSSSKIAFHLFSFCLNCFIYRIVDQCCCINS